MNYTFTRTFSFSFYGGVKELRIAERAARFVFLGCLKGEDFDSLLKIARRKYHLRNKTIRPELKILVDKLEEKFKKTTNELVKCN